MGSVEVVSPRNMTGKSLGFDLRKDGGLGMPDGSKGMASAIAV